MTAQGTRVRRLTRRRGADYAPVWSRDGRRIAYTSVRGGDADLFVVNADGKRVRALVQSAAEDDAAAWSPDGRSIAFESDREIGRASCRERVWSAGGAGGISVGGV